jgi:hypothetical protein
MVQSTARAAAVLGKGKASITLQALGGRGWGVTVMPATATQRCNGRRRLCFGQRLFLLLRLCLLFHRRPRQISTRDPWPCCWGRRSTRRQREQADLSSEQHGRACRAQKHRSCHLGKALQPREKLHHRPERVTLVGHLPKQAIRLGVALSDAGNLRQRSRPAGGHATTARLMP